MKEVGLVQTIKPKSINVNSKFYTSNLYYAYYLGDIGHTIENCINLKYKTQDLIDQKVITLQTIAPNINVNLLTNHEGVTINMMEINEDWCIDKAIITTNFNRYKKVIASLRK